jgi:hypothetical protein
MTKKLMTNELINERLEEIGFGERQANNEDAIRENVLNHYNVEIHEDYRNADFHIYEETTADGYEVYVATHDMNIVNVSENVYYYDSDLADVLVENIKYSNGDEDYPHTIYISDIEAGYLEEALQRLFEYLVEKFTEEVIDELTDEGYED